MALCGRNQENPGRVTNKRLQEGALAVRPPPSILKPSFLYHPNQEIEMEDLILLIAGQFISGLTRGMVLFLVASGLTLVFGILSVLNFAHGSFYMLGAFFCYWFWLRLMNIGMGFWLSVLLSSFVLALIGFGIEVALLRKTYKRGHIPQLLLTYALTLIASDVVRMGWGGNFFTIPRPKGLQGSITLFGISVATYSVFIIILGFCIFVFLWILIYRTKLGKIIRAAVYDREVVSFLGIPIPWLFSLVFMLGIFLAGIAGGVYAPVSTVELGMDVGMLIECFAVIILGGVGNLTGTLIAALIVGEIYSFGILLLPQLALVFIYFILVIVLLIKPHGLSGRGLE